MDQLVVENLPSKLIQRAERFVEQEDIGIVPRPVLFGNFSLAGVCHAYVDDPAAYKARSGFNFPAKRDGERIAFLPVESLTRSRR